MPVNGANVPMSTGLADRLVGVLDATPLGHAVTVALGHDLRVTATVSSGQATLLAVHLLATAAMTGLIWFVQIVHYPLFAGVGSDGFSTYADHHQRRTSFVVGPFMATEGATALWLFARPPGDLDRIVPFVALAVLGVVLASTVLLQVPAHARLSAGHDAAVIRRLVRTNWVRTIGWSARSVLAVMMLVVAMG
jgi:hypothetical protein